MKEDKKNIIAVIPAYYEEGRIGITVKKTIPFVEKVLVVDDGSKDNTCKEARDGGALVIVHEVNQGAGAAIRTGIKYAIDNNYEMCVVLGGDDQDNPNEIHLLINKLNEGYDFVQGSRYKFGERTENIPLFRKITTKCHTYFFRLITGFPITDGTNGFRAFKLSIFKNKKINIWQKWLNKYELEPYLYYMSIRQKFRVAEVPVTKRYPEDNKPYTKMVPIVDWWSILRPLVFLGFRIRK